MADLPIIFSAPMVRALLDGRKTQTRRVIKPQPEVAENGSWRWKLPRGVSAGSHITSLPDVLARWCTYTPGDRLYVREAWTARMTHGWTIAHARSRLYQEEILYRADGHESIDGWWPSIHMPREFSRLTLTVTNVRVQQLQDISRHDALAEGVEMETADPPFYYVPGIWPHSLTAVGIEEPGGRHAERSFAKLWNNLHGPEAWDANPWVAAYSFTVQRGNIDQIGGAA